MIDKEDLIRIIILTTMTGRSTRQEPKREEAAVGCFQVQCRGRSPMSSGDEIQVVFGAGRVKALSVSAQMRRLNLVVPRKLFRPMDEKAF